MPLELTSTFYDRARNLEIDNQIMDLLIRLDVVSDVNNFKNTLAPRLKQVAYAVESFSSNQSDNEKAAKACRFLKSNKILIEYFFQLSKKPLSSEIVIQINELIKRINPVRFENLHFEKTDSPILLDDEELPGLTKEDLDFNIFGVTIRDIVSEKLVGLQEEDALIQHSAFAGTVAMRAFVDRHPELAVLKNEVVEASNPRLFYELFREKVFDKSKTTTELGPLKRSIRLLFVFLKVIKQSMEDSSSAAVESESTGALL